MHGWLDNAGTFDTLCPLLPHDIPILCIDFPGHGKSSHYPAGMTYTFYFDEVQLIRRLCQKYKWTRLTMMGHSLGAGVSVLYASMYPNDVEKIICLDTISPKLFDFEQYRAVPMPGIIIDSSLKYEHLTMEQQPTYNHKEMIDIVMQGHRGSLTRESAEILMKRGMVPYKKVGDNVLYRFTRDLRLINGNFGTFTMDVLVAIVEKIRCDVMVISADSSEAKFRNYSKVFDTIEKHARNFVWHNVPGTHHFHLNDSEAIVDFIANFLER